MTNVTPPRSWLDSLEEAEKKATPGPWSQAWNGDTDDWESGLGVSAFMKGGICEIGPYIRSEEELFNNAVLIALSRNHLPALLKIARAALAVARYQRNYERSRRPEDPPSTFDESELARALREAGILDNPPTQKTPPDPKAEGRDG